MAIGLAAAGTIAGLSAASGLAQSGMQAWQNDLNRKHATSERIGAQDFSALEASKLRDFNELEAGKARTFNRSEAQRNRAWQEYMSNTSYQRAMKDLQEAGLNPMLLMDKGGASTPTGNAASAQAASGGSAASSRGVGASSGSMGNPLGGLANALASVMMSNNTAQTADKMLDVKLQELDLKEKWLLLSEKGSTKQRDYPDWLEDYKKELDKL